MIEKVPSWMASVNVEFVCNNCPNRQTKNIAFVTLEPDVPATEKLEVDEELLEEVEVEAEAEAEAEEPAIVAEP
ncbi:MAG TPA: hypothetical protein VKT78_20740 [Fimbriimonadaceae bacterium]|nr:hypothetical protein [Fimbriimonadaceae bacterium]